MNCFVRAKYSCYTANISMALVGNLPALLFLTFRSLYGISYSLLGMLVLINFCTQLAVDLIFSFFSHKFNIPKTVKVTPLITLAGLLIYSLWPSVFPNHVYIGLVLGTVVFSASSGLSEVLLSPVIAAIPAHDPGREMSKLHSIYAWGVVFIIIFSTLFIFLFGGERWQILTLILTLIPMVSAIMFAGAEIPEMETPERVSGALKLLKNKGVWLCVLAIFLGGASECIMAQWSSGYLEQAMGIPKVWGDVFGVAMFALMLGIGRTLYSKVGKNVGKVLFLGSIGATVCYLISAVTSATLIGLFACAFTGFCVSMLWPGNIIVASDNFPAGGVFIYALMAAGGDMGASVGPQLIGIITDGTIASPKMIALAESLSLMPEQLGMKIGMLVGMLFPMVSIPVYYVIMKKDKKENV